MSPKIGYYLLVAFVMAMNVGILVLVFGARIRQRRRRVELARALASRFGIVHIRDMGATFLLVLDKPSFEGTLQAHELKSRSFSTVEFEGTVREPKSSFRLTSRRLLGFSSGDGNVELASPELRKQFTIVAERPDEVLPLFDTEMEELLAKLDAGLFHALIGPLAGITIAVQGTELLVTVIGQQGDDEEFLRRVLRLIERVAEYGQS